MTRRWLGAVAAVAAVGVGGLSGACTQVGTDPTKVVALAFDSLPYPAVVIGDTLRDEHGVAAPLRATAFNSDGNAIPDAAVTFVTLDPGVAIGPGRYVVSTDPAVTSARLVAQVAGLQSPPRTLLVTPRPDSAAQTTPVDTLRYVLPDGVANTAAPVNIRVLSLGAEAPVSVRGWIVRYRVEYGGQALPTNDTTTAWMVDPAGRRSAEDTTGTDGLAARRLRVVATALSAAVDSLVVTATVTAHGAPLAGTPIRVVIPVRPQ